MREYDNRRGSNVTNGSRGNMAQMRKGSSERDRSHERSNDRNAPNESRLRDSSDYDRAYKHKASMQTKKSRESLKDDRDGPTFRDPEIAKDSMPSDQ